MKHASHSLVLQYRLLGRRVLQGRILRNLASAGLAFPRHSRYHVAHASNCAIKCVLWTNDATTGTLTLVCCPGGRLGPASGELSPHRSGPYHTLGLSRRAARGVASAAPASPGADGACDGCDRE